MVVDDRERLLLRIPEAADRLGLGRSTVYELIQSGALPVIRVGRAIRIPARALNDWVVQQSAGDAVPALDSAR